MLNFELLLYREDFTNMMYLTYKVGTIEHRLCFVTKFSLNTATLSITSRIVNQRIPHRSAGNSILATPVEYLGSLVCKIYIDSLIDLILFKSRVKCIS